MHSDHCVNCDVAIFDCDGTLLDSLHVWDEIDEVSFAQRGKTVPHNFAQVTATMTPRQVAAYAIEHCGFTDSEETLMQEWSSMAEDAYAHRLPLRKGALRYVHNVHADGITTVLMTTLSASLCLPALRRTGLSDAFDQCWLSDDLPKDGKNSAHTYRTMADSLGCATQHCIVFEDSPAALRSARQAGMHTCAVGLQHNDLVNIADIDDIAEFVIEDFLAAPALRRVSLHH